MPRHDLTDQEFNAIRPLLPRTRCSDRGRPWIDHRKVINGILWILHTGSPWRDLPREFGKWQTVYNRFRRWVYEDLWDKIFSYLLHRLDSLGKIDRSLWCIDGSAVRAHRAASGMIPQSEENDGLNALGRSRGGYSTKLHVLTDANGTLIGVTATAGQTHEAAEFESLMANSCLSLHCRRNRPRALAGDKGYSSGAIRSWIQSKSICDVIPTRSNEATNPSFHKDTYRRRNIVERTIGWLKEARRIATRYDKLTSSYLAFVQLAAMRRMIKLI
jgi:transposase